MREPLDEIDLRLLEILQRDVSLSTAELAGDMGISQSQCWRRISRLRELGYIKSQVAILDWQKLGYTLQVFALVKMATQTDEQTDDFIAAVRAIPEIMECYSLFGERDFMLKIIATDVQSYQNFVFAKLLKLPGVADVQSMATLLEAKFTTAVPVAPNIGP